MNYLLIVAYVIFAVAGSTLIKYGGAADTAASFIVPLANLRLSYISLAGILSYGASFLLYILLLNRFDLSFISPLTVGIVYVLLMFTAVIVFHEQFTLAKIIGCVLILAGILLIISSAK